jgi:hypothetical protein
LSVGESPGQVEAVCVVRGVHVPAGYTGGGACDRALKIDEKGRSLYTHIHTRLAFEGCGIPIVIMWVIEVGGREGGDGEREKELKTGRARKN